MTTRNKSASSTSSEEIASENNDVSEVTPKSDIPPEVAPPINEKPTYPPRPGACKKCGEKKRSDGRGELICPVDDKNCPILGNS